jgi:hypothetical protein
MKGGDHSEDLGIDSIKIDLKVLRLEGVNWIHLAQDRGRWRALVNMVMNLRVPQKTGNFLTSWADY